MIKSYPFSASFTPHPRDVQDFLIYGYKYLRVVRNCWEVEDLPKNVASLLIRNIKSAKMLRKVSLQKDLNIENYIQPKYIRVLLKKHQRNVKNLNLYPLPLQFSGSQNLFPFLKNLRTLRIINSKSNIKSLARLKSLVYLFLDLRIQKFQADTLSAKLTRLVNLKSLTVLSSPALLKQTIELLNKFSALCDSPVKIQIITRDDEVYDDGIAKINGVASQRVTRVWLQYISSISLVDNLFIKPDFLFPNLTSLKLEFSVPNIELISYLKNLKDMKALEKLSLYFTECWTQEFSEEIIKCLKLPSSLKSLKLNMSLSLQGLITKNIAYQRAEVEQMSKYPWRNFNIFEEESNFASFFQALQDAPNLRKIKLDLQMLERFSSCYTNFFVSVLNRLPQLCTLVINVIDHFIHKFDEEISECFDLALFLEACSQIRSLQEIEVLMPNLLFEDAKLNPSLSNLKEFHIGISGAEEKGLIRFENISKCIRGILKAFSINAPNLKSLGLDFEELLDERDYYKRFLLIEKFKNLEFLYMKSVIKKLSHESVNNIGSSLKKLKRLNTLALKFIESDKSIYKIKTHLSYHKSLRDVIVSLNKYAWTGNEYMKNIVDVADEFDEMLENDSSVDILEIDSEESR